MPATTPKNSLATFREAHDRNVIVPRKIKTALAELLKAGNENWVYESDLLSLAKISTTDLAMFREQFAAHIVETTGKNPKRVWFASPKVAEAARAA